MVWILYFIWIIIISNGVNFISYQSSLYQETSLTTNSVLRLIHIRFTWFLCSSKFILNILSYLFIYLFSYNSVAGEIQ